MNEVAQRLRTTEVLNPDGGKIELGQLWQEHPVVLVFVRHFGWMFCREQVAQLRDKVAEIRQRGAELVVVGNGSAAQARDFRDERSLDFPLFADSKLKAYRAAGLRRGVGTSFNLRSMKNAVGTLSRKHFQGRTQGDPWQQGGTFVITPKQEVLFGHVSEVAGDHADMEAVLAALPAAGAGS